MSPSKLFTIAWITWALSWLVAALWSSRPQRRVPWTEAWGYRLVILAGVAFFWNTTARVLGAVRLWHVGQTCAYALAVLTILGFAFAWWARIYLGPLWSASVTQKEDHRVVDTGPYALVRHPIYTGLIFASFCTAMAAATGPALAGFCLILLGLWLKARLEERFLSSELEPGAYADYRRRVPMLVPFGPK